MTLHKIIIATIIVTSYLLALPSCGQQLRKRPLQYVSADSVFVLPKDNSSLIMDIMAVAPNIGPQPIVVTKADRKMGKQELAATRGAVPAKVLSLTARAEHHARMLLLTGNSSYAEVMDQAYFYSLRGALEDDGILPYSERKAAAQLLLNLTGTIFATDGNRNIYVNLFENCVARIHTKKFRLVLDVLSGYPDTPMVKFRIEGLDHPDTQFALHIRVPSKGAPDKFFVNGHEVLKPVLQDGYLVLDRKWHNGEEVYFVLKDI